MCWVLVSLIKFCDLSSQSAPDNIHRPLFEYDSTSDRLQAVITTPTSTISFVESDNLFDNDRLERMLRDCSLLAHSPAAIPPSTEIPMLPLSLWFAPCDLHDTSFISAAAVCACRELREQEARRRSRPPETYPPKQLQFGRSRVADLLDKGLGAFSDQPVHSLPNAAANDWRVRIPDNNPIEFLVKATFPNQCVCAFYRFSIPDLIDLAVSSTIPCEVAYIGRIRENLPDYATGLFTAAPT